MPSFHLTNNETDSTHYRDALLFVIVFNKIVNEVDWPMTRCTSQGDSLGAAAVGDRPTRHPFTERKKKIWRFEGAIANKCRPVLRGNCFFFELSFLRRDERTGSRWWCFRSCEELLCSILSQWDRSFKSAGLVVRSSFQWINPRKKKNVLADSCQTCRCYSGLCDRRQIAIAGPLAE
ncbi:hypothetical protein NPIL_374611 [Nephila pilipes]|uniref:Uncharacterized protein n=1 Tax=Nephila pilipes TaxID=299642 RepID=A0A8X6TBF5_NEPPI|nr:hypothetical protein NPIL_374611 [Nephila pilipes]